MDKVCDYCQCQYDDSLDNCPHCGAPNDFVRRGDGVPKTIEELKDWYVKHNLPAEEITRFFIGKNITEPRAFGIYKDENTGDFVVYKNKDNGSRAERYRGGDESYAVNELYLKLKEEINNQKNSAENAAGRNGYSNGNQNNAFGNNYGASSGGSNKNRNSKNWVIIVIIIIFVCWHLFSSIFGVAAGCTRSLFNAFSDSDYSYSEEYYYGDSDSSDDSGSSWDDDDDDWDSDSSWSSSDSWDSGSSDWGSDW